MKMKWRAAGILGGLLVLGAGTQVYAAEVTEDVTNDKSTAYVLETIDWVDKAAADVEKYAKVRKEATTDSDVVGAMPKGAMAEVIEQDGDWTKIESGEIEGYIKTKLLVFGDEAADLYEETYGVRGVVDASSLRVREEASTEAKTLGSKARGAEVKILDQEGEWYEVEWKDDTAYMCAEYIDIEEATAVTMEEYESMNGIVSVGSGELDLLAAIIECEAGGESYTGMVAVGAVVLNRVRDSRFPGTITEVIYQSGQFTPAFTGRLATVLSRGARSDCYDAARDALKGENPVGNALYFNTGSGRGMQLGNHQFY